MCVVASILLYAYGVRRKAHVILVYVNVEQYFRKQKFFVVGFDEIWKWPVWRILFAMPSCVMRVMEHMNCHLYQLNDFMQMRKDITNSMLSDYIHSTFTCCLWLHSKHSTNSYVLLHTYTHTISHLEIIYMRYATQSGRAIKRFDGIICCAYVVICRLLPFLLEITITLHHVNIQTQSSRCGWMYYTHHIRFYFRSQFFFLHFTTFIVFQVFFNQCLSFYVSNNFVCFVYKNTFIF